MKTWQGIAKADQFHSFLPSSSCAIRKSLDSAKNIRNGQGPWLGDSIFCKRPGNLRNIEKKYRQKMKDPIYVAKQKGYT